MVFSLVTSFLNVQKIDLATSMWSSAAHESIIELDLEDEKMKQDQDEANRRRDDKHDGGMDTTITTASSSTSATTANDAGTTGSIDTIISNDDMNDNDALIFEEEMNEYILQSIETHQRAWDQLQLQLNFDSGQMEVKEENMIQSIFLHDGSFKLLPSYTNFNTAQEIKDDFSQHLKDANCRKWIIIVPQSKSLASLLNTSKGMKNWCTLIVHHEGIEANEANMDSQNVYHTTMQVHAKHDINNGHDPIRNYLDILSGKNSNIARRNFGHLLAIIHGAEYILDLDEHFNIDQFGHEHEPGGVYNGLLPDDIIMEASVVIQGRVQFNPYSLLFDPTNHYPSSSSNSTVPTSILTNTNTTVYTPHTDMGKRNQFTWPRGFPGLMPSSQRDFTKGKIAFQKNFSLSSTAPSLDSNLYHVGVIQLVGDEYEDIGLVQHFQRGMGKEKKYGRAGARRFSNDSGQRDTQGSIVAPSHSFAPYNMHSTIHMPSTLWSLFLPISLSPRQADIARSYFAQCLFPDVGIRVAYSPSVVRTEREFQTASPCDRNQCKMEADAEIEMLVRLDSMIRCLSKWDSPHNTLPARMEHLWRDLYARRYIQQEDVQALQFWLQSLQQIGYEFPSLSKRRYRNVAVMGHFNYAQSPSQVDDVVFWTQKYREWFETVVVTGPFSNEHKEELELHSIKTIDGSYNDEGGYLQVTENFKNALLYFKNETNIDSVMYFHDDGMINVTELSQGQYPFPTNDIIGNYRDQRYDLSYADVRMIKDAELVNQFSYRIFPNATVCAFNKTLCQPSVKKLYRSLPLYQWGMTAKAYCGEHQQKLAQDEEIFPYHEEDGSLLFSSFTQSDFLHMPIKYADEFAKLASIFLKHEVIHECAWGTIIDMIRKKFNATVRVTMLCTSWGPKRRGKKALIDRCIRDRVDYGVFHPYKIGYAENGYRGYDWALDIVQDRKSPS